MIIMFGIEFLMVLVIVVKYRFDASTVQHSYNIFFEMNHLVVCIFVSRDRL